MSTYFDIDILAENDLIIENYKSNNSSGEEEIDTVGFTADMGIYLTAADNKYINIINSFKLDVADVPTYADGMDQNAIDYLEAYICCLYFNRKFTVANEADANQNAKTSWCNKAKELYEDLTVSIIMNDQITDEAGTGIALASRGSWE